MTAKIKVHQHHSRTRTSALPGGSQALVPKSDCPANRAVPAASGRVNFGIYVHWPFCAAKCPYCDFNSHVRSEVDETGWVQAILHELEWTAGLQGSARPAVESIFFGGGTPSLLGGKAIGRVIDAIARLWPVAQDAEITLESNPASADARRFRDYRSAGVNRLSLGVQALDDAALRFLGRLHDAEEARRSLAMACSTFERVSFDLIYARPHQSLDEWRQELKEALAFGTGHLSLYQLTIEEGTPFAQAARNGALAPPEEEAAAALYELTQELTCAAGMPAYEISNHARPGEECRHNLIYWRYGDYAGVGPGAHGRLSIDSRRVATVCEKLPERWREKVAREGHGLADMLDVTPEDAAREHLLMALRLSEGLDLAEFHARWNAPIDEAKIASLMDDDLLFREDATLKATPKGRLVLNALVAALAP
jgi:oxygen-independent coproporphyrinogen-3 oxidase